MRPTECPEREHSQRQRDRETERDGNRDRDRDRQTDRKTERQTDRQTDSLLGGVAFVAVVGPDRVVSTQPTVPHIVP